MRTTNETKYIEIAADPKNAALVNNIVTYIQKELKIEFINDYNNTTTRDILNKVKCYKLYLLKVR